MSGKRELSSWGGLGEVRSSTEIKEMKIETQEIAFSTPCLEQARCSGFCFSEHPLLPLGQASFLTDYTLCLRRRPMPRGS